MSVDILQERIRKSKNPCVLLLEPSAELVPPQYLEDEENIAGGFAGYCVELLESFREIVPAVAISYGAFACFGVAGLEALERVRSSAKELGYYVICDAGVGYTGSVAQSWGQKIFVDEDYDALTINPYAGTDTVKAYLEHCQQGKMLVVQVRTANKTGAELQDLMTGGRLVHTAVADLAYRWGQTLFGRCGYRQVCGWMGANSGDSIRNIRARYKELFVFVSGVDTANGNFKNASMAFDRLGHGGAVVVGPGVLGAWQDSAEEPVAAAVDAMERMKKNITRYVTIL